jgi:predicted RNA-binding Zn-ribbon protein involved in translation (DUF1610 family)
MATDRQTTTGGNTVPATEIIYDGVTYHRYPNGKHPNYFFSTTGKQRLHRVIYEKHFGKIPTRHHVHHADGDPFNNTPGNLVVLSNSEHAKEHGILSKCWSEQRQDMLALAAVRDEARRNWSKQRVKMFRDKAMETARKRVSACVECGKPITITNTHQKYCCPNCRKHANTRACTLEYTCVNCGKPFTATGYGKHRACSQECRNILSHPPRNA